MAIGSGGCKECPSFMKHKSWTCPFFWKWMEKISRWILALVLITVGFGFIAFPIMIERLHNPNISEKTDGIVLFTGEIDREKTAWDLFRLGLAPKFHISGRYRGFNRPYYSPNITIDFAATTEKNVEMTHQWILKNHIHSVRLVTSDYHMPRCMLLANYFWKGIKIVPHPIRVQNSRLQHPMVKILVEYVRYVGTMILYWGHCMKRFYPSAVWTFPRSSHSTESGPPTTSL